MERLQFVARGNVFSSLVRWSLIGCTVGLFPSCGVKINSLAALQKRAASLALEFAPERCLVRGGEELVLSYEYSEGLGDVQALVLEESVEGAAFTTITHLELAESEYRWRAPVLDLSSVEFRLTAIDSTGARQTTQSCAIVVDATPPAPPAVSLVTPALTNADLVRATVASCADRAAIYVGHSAAVPGPNAAGWFPCSSAAGAHVSTLIAEGPTTLYFFAKDEAGNVSTSGSPLAVDYDATPPALTLLSLDSAGIVLPAQAFVSYRWSATDTHLGVNPIMIETSSDSGANWVTETAATANDGVDPWFTPNVTSSTYRVRISARDAYGNVTRKVSSHDIAITQTQPAITFVTFDYNPSNSGTTPTMYGSASGAVATVRLYSNAACTNLLLSGTRNDFVAVGMQLSLPGNTVSTIYGIGNDGATDSPCTYLSEFVHDSLPPSDPVFLSLTPPSPSNASSPRIRGLLVSDVASIGLFSNAGCTVSLGSGLRADFLNTGIGIPLAVSANGVTNIYGRSTDAAGNNSACVSLASYRHDSVAPTAVTALTHTPTHTSVTESPPLTWSGGATDAGGSGVDRYEISLGTAAGNAQVLGWTTVAGGTSPTLPYTLTGLNLNSGTLYYANVRVVDLAGNVSAVYSSTGWEAQAGAAPVIAPAALTLEINSQHTFTTAGGVPPFTYAVAGGAGAGTIQTNSGLYTAPAAPGGPHVVRVTDANGQTSDSAVTIVGDITAPIITSFSVNSNAANASGFYLPVSISATDPGASSSGITHYRFSTLSNFSDAAWVATPPARFGFPLSSGARTLYAQVRDGAGNLSAVSSRSFTSVYGLAPTISLLEPDGSVAYALGDQVTISWTVASTLPIPADGISIFTLPASGSSTTPWPSGGALPDGASNGCTKPASASGCTRLTIPPSLAGQPFRLAVQVRDSGSNTAITTSGVLNLVGLSVYAGRNGFTAGGNALSTYIGEVASIGVDPSNNDLYFVSDNRLMMISSGDGRIHHISGSSVDTTYVGGAVAAARFADGAAWVKSIHVDAARNVYWASLEGILKYDRAAGTVAKYVSKMTAPFSAATGTHRLSIDADHPTRILAGNNRLYVEVQSNCDTADPTDSGYWASPTCTRLYRIEDDDTVTLMGGHFATSPTTVPDPTAGADARTVMIRSFGVQPGATPGTDRIYATGGGIINGCCNATLSGFWEILADHSLSLVRGGIEADYIQGYLPSRGVFMYTSYANGWYAFFDPANPAAAVVEYDDLPGNTRIVRTVADFGGGAYVYSISNDLRIHHRTAALAGSIYAGSAGSTGIGGLAIQAQIGTIGQLTMNAAGDSYLRDWTNGASLHITPTGILQRTAWNQNDIPHRFSYGFGEDVLFSSEGGITLGSNPFSAIVSGFRGLADAARTCVLFCGAGTDPPLVSTAVSANAESLYVGGSPAVTLIAATEGTDRYVYHRTVEEDPDPNLRYARSSIRKIVASGAMTTLAGDPTSTNITMPIPLAAGTALAGNNPGYTEILRVANGILFVANQDYWGGGRILSAAPGGNWVSHTSANTSGFVVDKRGSTDPLDSIIYYISNTEMRMKVYAANGLGTDTLVVDFAGILQSPHLFELDPTTPHTFYIRSGSQVYRYTNNSLP